MGLVQRCSRAMTALGFILIVISSYILILKAEASPKDVHIHLYGVSMNGQRESGSSAGDVIQNEHGGQNCFPRHWPGKGCPYRFGVRIVNQVWNTRDTERRSHEECMNYCKELAAVPHTSSHSMVGCFAWSFNEKTNECYTYNTYPRCYNLITISTGLAVEFVIVECI